MRTSIGRIAIVSLVAASVLLLIVFGPYLLYEYRDWQRRQQVKENLEEIERAVQEYQKRQDHGKP